MTNNIEMHEVKWLDEEGHAIPEPTCSCGQVLPPTDDRGLHPKGTDPYLDHVMSFREQDTFGEDPFDEADYEESEE